MLQRSRNYRQQIFAWELVNEPEWILRRRDPRGNRENDVNLGDLRQFLNLCGRTVTAAGFPVTIGFVRENTVFDWDPFYERPRPTMQHPMQRVLSVRMRRPARWRRWSPGPIVFSGVEQLSGGHSDSGGVSWSL